jgi:positive regulator of sigma E activity
MLKTSWVISDSPIFDLQGECDACAAPNICVAGSIQLLLGEKPGHQVRDLEVVQVREREMRVALMPISGR